MFKPTKQWLNIEFPLMAIATGLIWISFLGNYLLFEGMMIYGLLLMLPVGALQMLSGIVFSKESPLRLYYLLGVAVFVVLMAVLFNLTDKQDWTYASFMGLSNLLAGFYVYILYHDWSAGRD